MTQSLSNQQYQALHRLMATEFAPFHEVLAALRHDYVQRLAKADETVTIYRAQGAMAAIDDLSRRIETAHTHLR